ncbi:MAG: glycosyltransferase family 9 protein [Gemmatimonadota bacterium]
MLDGQRVAVVLLSAIGDIVHALPLVSSLKSAAPALSVEWVTQPVPGEIASRHPGVDRLWTLERHRGWRAYRDLARTLRGRRFDLVLDLQVYAKASLVTALLDSPRKIGFDRARAGAQLAGDERADRGRTSAADLRAVPRVRRPSRRTPALRVAAPAHR